ncbi:MAG: 5-formyltetrahydrofolate cyclo-ligase [Oscillospiraceae bacterium]|nr:5-formyltetrahydrofolate cyclo-ligase [Oscillospiraceae bacterium]
MSKYEILGTNPLFILDNSDNKNDAEALLENVNPLFGGMKVTVIMAANSDSDYQGVISSLAPAADVFFALTPDTDDALSASKLSKSILLSGCEAITAGGLMETLGAAFDNAGERGIIVAVCPDATCNSIKRVYLERLKKWLRKRKIDDRNSLEYSAVDDKSAEIANKILSSEEFERADTIMLYRAFRNEVDLSYIVLDPRAFGKRFVYPLCVAPGEMIALLPKHSDAWKSGYQGIVEPVREYSFEINPDEIDMIVCPCAAFDTDGRRLGMGGGFYDRFLAKCPHAVKVAAAYEIQKVTAVPVKGFDYPMDIVFTEAEEYRRYF